MSLHRLATTRPVHVLLGTALVALVPLGIRPSWWSSQGTPAAGGASALPEADAVLGAPLVIHGDVVPSTELRKAIVLGTPGQSVLNLAKLRVWCDEEIARRVAAGESAESFTVTEEEVQARIQEQEEQLLGEYPNGDVTLADVLPDVDKLPERLKTIELFNNLFLPEDVSRFPQITIDAMNGSEVGQTLLKQLQEEGSRDSNPFLDGVLFEQVYKYLESTSDIQEGEDLPVELALRINGKEVRVDDLWKEVASSVSELDVRKAKQWIVNMRLLREDLEKGGQWLGPEAALVKYKEHSDPWKDEIFSQENIALSFKRFPTLRAYRDFRQAYDSFRQKIQAELTPENLKAFAERRTRALIGQSLIDADVILLSAFDFKTQRWKPDGWAEARRRAEETSKAIAADPSRWDEILDENSDFYDPPVPASMEGKELPDRKNKGRFRSKSRNPFMNMLDESEYWGFLNGKTITDFVCFEQTVGTIANPIRGPFGYYIPRLLRRTSAPPSATLSEADLIEMADQDYTMYRMTEHAQELIRKNQVFGLE